METATALLSRFTIGRGHSQILRDSKQERALLPKKGALQAVKTEIRLWYFCGQTRNYRSSHCGNFQFWWTVRGSNPRPRRCERRALPAELTAQISHLSIKKVMKNGLLRYSILREKSEKTNEKLETKIGAVMCVYIDANRTLSQLSYRPIQSALSKMKDPCCGHSDIIA